jgi:hypothetical protein
MLNQPKKRFNTIGLNFNRITHENERFQIFFCRKVVNVFIDLIIDK